jgi:hypothetical protein
LNQRLTKLGFSLFIAATLFVVACGKNAPNTPYGPGQFYPQAPLPNGSMPYYQNGGSPYGSPYGYNAPNANSPYYFNPQMPSGFPQSYYPFLPIDNYFRNNPQYGQPYWNGLWNHWQNTAHHWGVSPYDFTVFWNEYCPQVWTSGQEHQIFVHFNQTFYHWAQPQVVIPAVVNPTQFWTHYIGIYF